MAAYYEPKRRRELSGGRDMWMGIIPGANIAQLIAGWFSASVETFLRRDMGERFYSTGNFWIGLVVLVPFLVTSWGNYRFSSRGKIDLLLMLALIGGYVLLGGFMLARNVYLRNTNQPDHTMSPGMSRLRPFAPLVLGFGNRLTKPVFEAVVRMLPPDRRVKLDKERPIFSDKDGAALLFLEPAFCIVVGAVLFFSGFVGVGMWLLLSSAAVALHNGLYWQAQYQQGLDLNDSLIEAGYMRKALTGTPREQARGLPVFQTTRAIVEQAATTIKDNPDAWQQVQQSNPDSVAAIGAAVAQLHPDLQALINGSGPASTLPPLPATTEAAPMPAAPQPVQVDASRDGQTPRAAAAVPVIPFQDDDDPYATPATASLADAPPPKPSAPLSADYSHIIGPPPEGFEPPRPR